MLIYPISVKKFYYKNKTVNLMVALEESSPPFGTDLLGYINICAKSGPALWTDWQTNMLLPWLEFGTMPLCTIVVREKTHWSRLGFSQGLIIIYHIADTADNKTSVTAKQSRLSKWLTRLNSWQLTSRENCAIFMLYWRRANTLWIQITESHAESWIKIQFNSDRKIWCRLWLNN